MNDLKISKLKCGPEIYNNRLFIVIDKIAEIVSKIPDLKSSSIKGAPNKSRFLDELNERIIESKILDEISDVNIPQTYTTLKLWSLVGRVDTFIQDWSLVIINNLIKDCKSTKTYILALHLKYTGLVSNIYLAMNF